MAEAHDDRPVLPSLLDRLTDEDPERSQEVPLVGRKLEKLLREAIRRDIEGFLNTKRRCVSLPPEFEHVRGTILDYGVPDFLGQTLSSDRKRQQFLREIEDSLKQHEPRFKSVSIELVGGLDEAERSFHFRIQAIIYAEPAPESLSFDSLIEPVSRKFSIKL